jgi:uncharacterized protein (TIGR02266 family)
VKPKLKLESVTQLERELGQRRGTLMQLISDREREQLRLAAAREEYRALEAEIRGLDKSIATKNQTIFVLMDEVDWLLRVQERVHERARELGKTVAAGDNQRNHSRHAIAVEVTAQSETHFYTGFSQNISEGGLFIATYDTRPVGERFPVEFTLPTASAPLRCMAEVAWVREYREGADLTGDSVPGMGLRFIGLGDDSRAQIAAFLEQREPLFFPEFDEL